jgi:ubiquinone/menaquinone biosynthesis C-methylase UbiE
MRTPNKQLNIADPGSLPVRAAAYARRKMYRQFIKATDVRPTDSVLDVGATADRTYEASNYLEAWFPYKQNLVAVGLDEASFLELDYPGVRYIRADGRSLPFADRLFDVVHCSAVIEHAGEESEQEKLLLELARVARRAVFLTTPNRWYPIEFHTLLPFAHWLPRQAFEAVLRRAGREAFADVKVLNLLSRRRLMTLTRTLNEWDASLEFLWFLGWPSNLLLTLKRAGDRPGSKI